MVPEILFMLGIGLVMQINIKLMVYLGVRGQNVKGSPNLLIYFNQIEFKTIFSIKIRNNMPAKKKKKKKKKIIMALLRSQFKQKRFAAERLPKFEFGSLGKRSKTFITFNTFGTLATFQDVSDVFNVHLIYICRYFADRQLLFLAVNTFIH